MKKKIFNITIYLLLLFSIFMPNVYAEDKINIESATLVEKSEDVIEFGKPTIDNMSIGFNLSFVKINDYAKYKVIISNNSNKDYYLDNEKEFSSSDYIKYIYEYEDNIDKIKPNSKMEIHITVKYEKEVPLNKLVNGVYKESNNMSIDLADIIITNPETYPNILINPETYSNILVVIFIVTGITVYSVIRVLKHKKARLSIIVIPILLLPMTIHALERFTIKVETNIIIEKSRNIMESKYENDSYNDRDFWQYSYYAIKTVTFETKIEEPSNYAYRFDVSEEKNNSIIAYLVENADDSSKYDLYIMSDGYIYANPDSSRVFEGWYYLTEINNIENYKTNYVTNMRYMFSNCNNLTSLDLSSFDTSNVTDMGCMLSGAIGTGGTGILRNLNVSGFDTSNVTNMEGMFSSHFDLEELDLSSFDTSNVTNMSRMFSGCTNLKELDLSNFDTSNVTNMDYMFNYDSNLETIYVSNKWTVGNVTSSGNMFYDCTKLPNFNSSITDKTNANTSSTGYLTLKS